MIASHVSVTLSSESHQSELKLALNNSRKLAMNYCGFRYVFFMIIASIAVIGERKRLILECHLPKEVPSFFQLGILANNTPGGKPRGGVAINATKVMCSTEMCKDLEVNELSTIEEGVLYLYIDNSACVVRNLTRFSCVAHFTDINVSSREVNSTNITPTEDECRPNTSTTALSVLPTTAVTTKVPSTPVRITTNSTLGPINCTKPTEKPVKRNCESVNDWRITAIVFIVITVALALGIICCWKRRERRTIMRSRPTRTCTRTTNGTERTRSDGGDIPLNSGLEMT